MVERDGRWEADGSCAPLLVPVLSLGRRVVATEGVGVEAGTYSLADAEVDAGGPRLRSIALSEELFAAAAMQARHSAD